MDSFFRPQRSSVQVAESNDIHRPGVARVVVGYGQEEGIDDGNRIGEVAFVDREHDSGPILRVETPLQRHLEVIADRGTDKIHPKILTQLLRFRGRHLIEAKRLAAAVKSHVGEMVTFFREGEIGSVVARLEYKGQKCGIPNRVAPCPAIEMIGGSIGKEIGVIIFCGEACGDAINRQGVGGMETDSPFWRFWSQ